MSRRLRNEQYERDLAKVAMQRDTAEARAVAAERLANELEEALKYAIAELDCGALSVRNGLSRVGVAVNLHGAARNAERMATQGGGIERGPGVSEARASVLTAALKLDTAMLNSGPFSACPRAVWEAYESLQRALADWNFADPVGVRVLGGEID